LDHLIAALIFGLQQSAVGTSQVADAVIEKLEQAVRA